MKALLALSLVLVSSGCGGDITDGGRDTPESAPPYNGPSYTLRIDGEAIELEAPSTTRYVYDREGIPSRIVINADDIRSGGDSESSSSVSLNEPLAKGTFDCTPNEAGEWVNKRGIFSPGFLEFAATLTDCSITLTYIASDRVVGRFTTKVHPPETSSLAGQVSVAEGEFDVAIEKELKL